MNSPAPSKSKIRRLAKARRKGQANIGPTSKQIGQRLLDLDAVASAKTVCCYVSFRDEVHTHELICHWLKQGKTIAVPYCHEPDLEIHRIESFAELQPGMMQILEPDDRVRKSGERKMAAAEFDVIIVPGLGFTKHGVRLGYGRGYYDRLLRDQDRVEKIGICFECQIFDWLPCGEHDVVLNRIVTETNLYDCG